MCIGLARFMIRAPSSEMSLTQTEVQLVLKGLRETANLIRLIVSPRVTGSKRCSDASPMTGWEHQGRILIPMLINTWSAVWLAMSYTSTLSQ
ncbi:hypothetical protein D6D13_04562 [Aureobasidium pullulans]|uniref:Uncharacterized protein n=2 Tax=Aureobasidium pullulans TaxID=5580 RepID=A0A4S9CW72_AURPU|nr:hypothetical protein D6D13_04562 [Aureobasidium pullulans]